ncbi:MAG: GNAT family N-acetyltransferase [Frankiaceae bacterium]
MPSRIDVHPVSPKRWPDVEALLGQGGAVRGCWCMHFRGKGAELHASWGAGNRAKLKGMVDEGKVPGLLAYLDGAPAGWCSVAPREEYGRLLRSPITRREDDVPVWSLVCLFVDPAHRGKGVATALVRAAVDYARSTGATTIEAYPVDDRLGPVHPDSGYHGVVSLLEPAGFREVARRRPRRPRMEVSVGDRRSSRARPARSESPPSGGLHQSRPVGE